MDTHIDLRNPNPFEDSKINRREALIGVAGLVGLVGVASGIDHMRSYITRMTPSQRNYLNEVLAANPSWINLSDTTHGEAKWLATHTDGASITVSIRSTHEGDWRNIEVSNSRDPFHYKCPEWRHSTHDQPVVDNLLASVGAGRR